LIVTPDSLHASPSIGGLDEMFTYDEDYHIELDSLIACAIDEYSDDFREYWGLDDTDPPEGLTESFWGRLRELDRLAYDVVGAVLDADFSALALGAAVELRSEAMAEKERLDQWVQDLREDYPELTPRLAEWREAFAVNEHDYRFFLSCLKIHLSKGGVAPRRADRLIDLAALLSLEVRGRVRAHLAWAVRLYLVGQEPRFAVACRTALEAALEEAAPDDVVRKNLGIERWRRVGLGARIEYAHREGLLSDEAAEAARTLKNQGDEVLHVLPHLAPGFDTSITRLAVVLKALSSSAE